MALGDRRAVMAVLSVFVSRKGIHVTKMKEWNNELGLGFKIEWTRITKRNHTAAADAAAAAAAAASSKTPPSSELRTMRR
jgi:hypothetical protein